MQIHFGLGCVVRFLTFVSVRSILKISLILCCVLRGFAQPASHLHLIAGMLDSIQKVETLRFRVLAIEKVGNTYFKAVSDNKILMKPHKVYFRNPEKKLEILYVEGENDDKALVKPHVFPYVTMSLSTTGSLMRKNQHYTLHELGFEFLAHSVAIALSKEKENFAKAVTYFGKHEKNGYTCHLFVYEARNFPYTEYTVKANETVTSIALKLNLNEYLIRHKNNLINEFDYLKPGMKLKVPVYYCKKVVLFIDDKKLLPVSVSVFDDDGLLESYDFTNIIVNKPFDPKEFTRDYPAYHF